MKRPAKHMTKACERGFLGDDILGSRFSLELVVPRGISISSSLIESWFGRPLDGPGWD